MSRVHSYLSRGARPHGHQILNDEVKAMRRDSMTKKPCSRSRCKLQNCNGTAFFDTVLQCPRTYGEAECPKGAHLRGWSKLYKPKLTAPLHPQNVPNLSSMVNIGPPAPASSVDGRLVAYAWVHHKHSIGLSLKRPLGRWPPN